MESDGILTNRMGSETEQVPRNSESSRWNIVDLDHDLHGCAWQSPARAEEWNIPKQPSAHNLDRAESSAFC